MWPRSIRFRRARHNLASSRHCRNVSRFTNRRASLVEALLFRLRPVGGWIQKSLVQSWSVNRFQPLLSTLLGATRVRVFSVSYGLAGFFHCGNTDFTSTRRQLDVRPLVTVFSIYYCRRLSEHRRWSQ